MSGIYSSIFDLIEHQLVKLAKDYIEEKSPLENLAEANQAAAGVTENSKAKDSSSITNNVSTKEEAKNLLQQAEDRISGSPDTVLSSGNDTVQSEPLVTPAPRAKQYDLTMYAPKTATTPKNGRSKTSPPASQGSQKTKPQQNVSSANDKDPEITTEQAVDAKILVQESLAPEPTPPVATEKAAVVEVGTVSTAANLPSMVAEMPLVLAQTPLVLAQTSLFYVLNGYKLLTHDRAITNEKIKHFRDFIENIKVLSKDLPSATILAPRQSLGGSPEKIKIREEELNELRKKISIVLAYAENTKVKFGLARDGKKPAGTAESRIEVIIEMLQWLMSEEAIHVLHLVLGKESKAKNPQSTHLYKLSAALTVDVFTWVFYIKLHETKVKHGVIAKREIDPMIAQSLLKGFLGNIATLHTSLHQPFASIRDDNCNPEEKLEWQKQIIDELTQYVKTEKTLLNENNIYAQNFYVSYIYNPTFLQKVAKSLEEYAESLAVLSKDITLAISDSTLSGKITQSRAMKNIA